MKINIFFILRCLVAVVFIISGTEKLMNPVENFIYVIQGYDIIHNADLEDLIAQVFPWIELFTGAFLLLGLWTKLSLLATGAMAGGFVIFV